jgi:hypothetical protein
MSKWFCDTSTSAATGATRYGSFVGGALVSWSLAIDERGGHEGLRGSGYRSVIPYVHGRTGVILLKPTLPEPAFSPRPCEEVHARAFYSLRSDSYIETQGPTGGPGGG